MRFLPRNRRGPSGFLCWGNPRPWAIPTRPTLSVDIWKSCCGRATLRRKFEVVNTGSVAINSHVLLPIAKGLAEQRPDVFIIYSGNNEVVGPYGPGTALTSSGMSLPVIRSSIFIRATRIGQLLTKVGTQKKQWGGMEMFLDKQVPESSPLMKYTYANFETNLRDTVAVARNVRALV